MKVESVLSELLAILNADRADYFIFGLGMMVVVWLVTYTAICRRRQKQLHMRIKVMEDKYHLLNLSNVRLWDRVDPLMVKNHYSGDYSIEDRGNKKTNGEVP
jgi:hypothetical protein